MERAVELALKSEREGNLPIGAILVLGDTLIAEGKSEVRLPVYDPGAHAEMRALAAADKSWWPRAREMTCYTTLEPCVMCMGSLLLHGVGRVVFGANDVQGGAGPLLAHLPPYYASGGVPEWVGPLMPEVCDPLYRRADEAFAQLPCGRAHF
jgi:tRNA(adenine34) deaminase